MRKINFLLFRVYITPFVVGALSSIAAYLVFRTHPMLTGFIFGLISAVYFYFKYKTRMRDLFIWVFLSWLSFVLAFSSGVRYTLEAHSGDVNGALGVGGAVGILVLILAFRASFYPLNVRDVFVLVGVSTFIPGVLGVILDPTADSTGYGPAVRFWLPLFMSWQTFVLLYFAYVINRRLAPSVLQNEGLVVGSSSLHRYAGTGSDVRSKGDIVSESRNSNVTLVKMAYGFVFVFLNSAFIGGTSLYHGPFAGRFMEIVTWIISNGVFVSALAVVSAPNARYRKLRLALPVIFCVVIYLLSVI